MALKERRGPANARPRCRFTAPSPKRSSGRLSGGPQIGDCRARIAQVSSAISIVSAKSGEKPAILQIVPTLETGGAERTTVDVAAALVREDFTSLVVTSGGRMVTELMTTGAECIEMPVHRKSPDALIANTLRIGRIIRMWNVKLVHARSRAPAWSAFVAARRAEIPFVTTYHGIYNAKNGVKRFYNSVMARGDAVIANSEWTARHIAAEYAFQPRRLRVIPRGVDLRRFDPETVSRQRIDALRARWGVREGDTVILLPGRLTRWKGQAVLIRALGKLKRSGGLENVKAVLAGDPQGRSRYQSELEDLAYSRDLGGALVIVGHVVDMPAAYLAADIVVSASTDPEGFGRIAAEASAMGRPVIATNHGGSREIVLPGRSGVLIDPDDPTSLAAALGELLAAPPEVRTRMGDAARSHIRSNFTVERMCADTIALYRELLQNPISA